MPDAKTYIRRIKHYGTDQVLETACRDRDLSDEGYEQVWESVSAEFDAPRRGSNLSRLQDRDYARKVFSNG